MKNFCLTLAAALLAAGAASTAAERFSQDVSSPRKLPRT
jgi:hypothetical protein